MREKCFEIGTIQAFLDGELASDALENVSRHIAVCNNCALLLAEAEEESAIAFSALEQEFNMLVPTQRLWTKINNSIERERKPFWQTVFAFFKNPAVTAFASLLIVFGMFIAYLNVNNENPKNIAALPEIKQNTAVALSNNPPEYKVNEPNPLVMPEKKVLAEDRISSKQTGDNYQVVKADAGANNKRKTVIRNSPNQNSEPDFSPKPSPAVYEYLPGEESYIKTIATLEKTVDSRKDEVLKPSARFVFEKDLAITDDAIKKIKDVVKKNPKNEAAKDMLRASYQNKIDILNSVAEKTELMASLK